MATTIVRDAFNGTPGSNLSAHAADIGGSWIKHPTYSAGNALFDSTATRISGNSTTNINLYYNSAVPDSADYDTAADFVFVTSIAFDWAWIVARCDTAVETNYQVSFYRQRPGWVLAKVVNGVTTTLASYSDSPANGTTRLVVLSIRGSTLIVTIDGIVRMQATDSDITAIGKVGVGTRLGSSSGGIMIDDIYAGIGVDLGVHLVGITPSGSDEYVLGNSDAAVAIVSLSESYSESKIDSDAATASISLIPSGTEGIAPVNTLAPVAFSGFPKLTSVIDTFDRSNASSLGTASSGETWNNWSPYETAPYKIVSNQATPTSTGEVSNGSYISSKTYGPHFELYAQVKLANTGDDQFVVGPIQNPTNPTYYMVGIDGTVGLWVLRNNDATHTDELVRLGFPSGFIMTNLNWVGMELVPEGSNMRINVFYKLASGVGGWIYMGSYLDTSVNKITSAGFIGIEGNQQTANTAFTDSLTGGTVVKPLAGDTIFVTTGLWTGSPTITYQWQRETSIGSGIYADISGETGTTYTVLALDSGLNIRCNVTATESASTTVSSNPVLVPVNADIGTATIVLSPSGIEGITHVDSGSASMGIIASGVEITPADTAIGIVDIAESSSDIGNFVDTDTSRITVNPSAIDIESGVDSNSVRISIFTSSADIVQNQDSNTGLVLINNTSVEGRTSTDANSSIINIQTIYTDAAQFEDSNAVGLKISPSSADITFFTDSNSAAVKISNTSADIEVFIDSNTSLIAITASITSGSVTIDSNNTTVKIASAGVESLQYVDHNTDAIFIVPFTVFEGTGTVATDSSAINVFISPSAVGIVIDVDTQATKISIISTSFDTSAFIDTNTGKLTVTSSIIENLPFTDAVSVVVLLTPLGLDVGIFADKTGVNGATLGGFVPGAAYLDGIGLKRPEIGSIAGTHYFSGTYLGGYGSGASPSALLYSDQGITVVNLFVSSTENEQNVDTNTLTIATTASTLDILGDVDSNITSVAITPSTTDIAVETDSNAPVVVLNSSGAEIAVYIETNTAINIISADATEFKSSAGEDLGFTTIMIAPNSIDIADYTDSFASTIVIVPLTTQEGVEHGESAISNIAIVGSISDTANYIDSGVGQNIISAATTEEAQFTDQVITQVNINSIYVENVQFVDAALDFILVIASSVEIYQNISDSAIAQVKFTLSSVEQGQGDQNITSISIVPAIIDKVIFTDINTGKINLSVSYIENYTYSDAGTIKSAINPSSTEAETSVDSSTAHMNINTSFVERSDFSDAAIETINISSSISEVYTRGGDINTAVITTTTLVSDTAYSVDTATAAVNVISSATFADLIIGLKFKAKAYQHFVAKAYRHWAVKATDRIS